MSKNVLSAVYNVIPFKQVGPLKFGMSRADVLAILGPVDQESKTYRGGGIVEMRKNISTIYKNDKLNEVTFSPGVKVMLDGHSLLRQDGVNYLLEAYEHQSDDVGYTVFPTLGIGFTGFGKSKDAKVIMVFNKAILKRYLTP